MKDSNALDCLLAVLRSPERAAEFVRQPAMWQEIKRLAEVHRFTGHLAYSTSAWLPPSEKEWRDQILMTHHRRHARRLAALRRLVEVFAEERIPCVSLKGPLLAERFYEQPFLRPSNDLDLVVREGNIGRAARLVLRLGYSLDGSYSWDIHRVASHHLELHAPGSPEIELHYAMQVGRTRLEPAAFIERSVTWKSAAGFEAQVLSNADEAFHSCLHAASHAFRRLRWIYDFLRITGRLTPEERRTVCGMVREQGQTGPFAAARLALQEFFLASPALDCGDIPLPWLWRPLTAAHIRAMVDRVEGGGNLLMTSTFYERLAGRVDMGRLAGSPLKAAQVAAYFVRRMLRTRMYRFTHTPRPGALLASLPE
ncbi:MAG TPA: nucleotidyltransferase family protein [Bryobacteraceae bacterium]|nr:nucleotidyltransferase family protein [Bryobacteraceae bacterium]